MSLRLPYARFDACPTQLASGTFWMAPCASVLAGPLHGSTGSTLRGEPKQLFFGAAGPQLRLAWIPKPVFIGARASAFGVWSAPVFRSQPSGRALLQVGRVAFETGAELGLVF